MNDHKPGNTVQTQFFPDRVLNVGCKGDSRVVKLDTRLSSIRCVTDYATLSYCWGDVDHLKLESATMERLRQGVQIKDLPRTMRHAVALIRELGLRFLWIDSLCIIQDSVDDWRTQSALMGSIYQHSKINLAASASTNSESGLVFDRDPKSIQPVQVSCRFPFNHAKNPVQLYNVQLQNAYTEPVIEAPLSTRGWVMQERLLAPRTLHCTQEQLFWECEHMFASEAYPHGIETTRDREPSKFRRMLKRFSQGTAAVTTDSIHREPDVAWLSLVQEYTRCKLTKDEDILIAMSGLAKQWSATFPDQYLAGIWKQSLAEGLVWHGEARVPRYSGGECCPTWRAPSWSWASFKGAVSWNPHVIPLKGFPFYVVAKLKLIELVDTDLVVASADQTGQLLRGSITVRAPLIGGIIGSECRSQLDSGTAVPDNSQHHLEMTLSYGAAARDIVIRTTGYEYTGYCHFDSDAMRKQLDGEKLTAITCFPTLFHFVTNGGSESDVQVDVELQGMFIERVRGTQSSKQSYKRIGFFCVSSKVGNFNTGWSLCQSLMCLSRREIASVLGLGELEDIVLI